MSSTKPVLPGATVGLEEAHARAAPRHTFAVPQIKIPMVQKTMGAAPMAEVEAIQLLAGIPIPAHLGPNVDTSA